MEEKIMKRMQKTTSMFAILALVFILVGCSTPTVVSQPTQDIPSIRTESARTVVAKITIEAALQPTATTPLTDTPAPVVFTATSEPTPTVPPATATLIPTATRAVSGGGGGGGVIYPTATRRAGPDQASLLSQDPMDGANFTAGVEFDGSWTFKNIGTSTWTTGYEYRHSGGTNLAKAKIYTLRGPVKPGETITIYADMVAPAEQGRYVSNWELVNENGDVFFNFFLVIDVF
jgi:hypothetical protein